MDGRKRGRWRMRVIRVCGCWCCWLWINDGSFESSPSLDCCRPSDKYECNASSSVRCGKSSVKPVVTLTYGHCYRGFDVVLLTCTDRHFHSHSRLLYAVWRTFITRELGFIMIYDYSFCGATSLCWSTFTNEFHACFPLPKRAHSDEITRSTRD